jgi:hypothetical protein
MTTKSKTAPELVSVQMLNAGQTSAGYHQPGDVVALPEPEASPLVQAGYAIRVRS